MIEILVEGEPIPAARPRFSGGRVYQPKRNSDFRQLVKTAARSVMNGREPLTGEVLGISEEFGDSTIGGSSSGSNNGSGGVSIGNVNVNLEISGVENAQDIVQKIREHAQEISDVVAASLSEAVATVHKNQTLCA